MDAPYYNGGPDDRPRFEPYGQRREQPAACYECGQDCEEEVRFDRHTFCSRQCLDAWVRR